MATFDSVLSHLSYPSWQSSSNAALIAYRGYTHQKDIPSTTAIVCDFAINILIALGYTFAAIPECICLDANRPDSNWTQTKIYGKLSLLGLAALINSKDSFNNLRPLEVRACLHALFGWEGADIACEHNNSIKNTTESLLKDFVNDFSLLDATKQKDIIDYINNKFDRSKAYDTEFLKQFQASLAILESHEKVDQACKIMLRKIHDELSKQESAPVTPQPVTPQPVHTPSPIPSPIPTPIHSPTPPQAPIIVPTSSQPPIIVPAPLQPPIVEVITPLKQSSESNFRNYAIPPSDSDRKNIHYITTTMGNGSWAHIIWNKQSLEKAGEQIESLHPLHFLQCVFTSTEAKAAMTKLKDSWTWPVFKNGLFTSLTNEQNKDNIKPEFIQDFAQKVGIDVTIILPCMAQCDWDTLVSLLIQHVS